jgi:hypothetical protein
MWEAQERYTYAQTFFKPLLEHLISENRLRGMSNLTVNNVVRSIGTLSYRDERVDRFLEEAKRRAEISKDMLGIQTLISTGVNIKSYTNSSDFSLIKHFKDTYTSD